MQSNNEELETSKEELQSVNEELGTVNNELQAKVVDLSHSNNDMKSLLPLVVAFFGSILSALLAMIALQDFKGPESPGLARRGGEDFTSVRSILATYFAEK